MLLRDDIGGAHQKKGPKVGDCTFDGERVASCYLAATYHRKNAEKTRGLATTCSVWVRGYTLINVRLLQKGFMNMKIDIKSALFGLAFGVLIMLVIAAVAPPATVGRYQIAGTASHGLVLDTATGEVWTQDLPADRGRSDVHFSQPKNGGKQ